MRLPRCKSERRCREWSLNDLLDRSLRLYLSSASVSKIFCLPPRNLSLYYRAQSNAQWTTNQIRTNHTPQHGLGKIRASKTFPNFLRMTVQTEIVVKSPVWSSLPLVLWATRDLTWKILHPCYRVRLGRWKSPRPTISHRGWDAWLCLFVAYRCFSNRYSSSKALHGHATIYGQVARFLDNPISPCAPVRIPWLQRNAAPRHEFSTES